MREIKFRGWNSKHNKRIYGDLFRSRGQRFITQDGIVSNPLAEPEDWRVEPESVGQFIGLLDKNGRGIYEGDIVEREEKNYEVVRDEQYLECAIYGDGEQYKMDVGLKVILRGNIYETPELLDE